jgi:hypothetical protein
VNEGEDGKAEKRRSEDEERAGELTPGKLKNIGRSALAFYSFGVQQVPSSQSAIINDLQGSARICFVEACWQGEDEVGRDGGVIRL